MCDRGCVHAEVQEGPHVCRHRDRCLHLLASSGRYTHIDGKVQVSQLTCTSCHGDPVTKSSAPPLGTHGETKTSDHAVGAHQQHLGASAWHRAGECVDCHLVPQSNLHSNGVMEVSWGAITAADGALPSWAAATYTCSGVYCHGSTLRPAKLGGALLRQPIWTTVNGS